ncbi:TFIIE alpha subunit-domain-containing protein [Cercophora samala]|uniref:TFIIE alpha subunit-domain-containing protein n=1 Tax=Cercophora samala TaxID=330535 RepID=A0AA39ZGZ3_9PEZI|nr:TFIIE alpha subunit-domain-containing protein [Cercophora samala]
MPDSLSLSQILIRSVIRAFHSTQEVLAVEALVQHSCLRDDELAYLLKMNTKDLHRLCASLRDARFLTVHTRPEVIEGKTRPVNRTYYYIDYQQTVDAIKWRVYKTDKDMQGIAKPQDESKEYSCPRCKSQWTQLEVLDSVSMQGFLCLRCEAVLERSQEQEQPGHQQLSRMNNQFKFMTDMLQQIDKGLVPECSFDKAIAVARPIVREATHEVLASVPVEEMGGAGMGKPSAVKGLANTGPKTMQVTISDGNEEAELVESRKRKERFLRENALPSWITDSSVPVPAATAAAAAAPVMSFKMEEDEEDDLEFEDVV